MTGDHEPESAAFTSSPKPSALEPGSLARRRAEWISFFDTHYHRVVRFLMHTGSSMAEAEDAAQEAFTESWALMDGNPEHWHTITCKEAWIRTVALRRYHRPSGPRRRPSTIGIEAFEFPDPCTRHDELTVQAQFVIRTLQNLDDQARTVMAFDLDGIPVADIARQLGITKQRVRDVRKKARNALKKELAATEPRAEKGDYHE